MGSTGGSKVFMEACLASDAKPQTRRPLMAHKAVPRTASYMRSLRHFVFEHPLIAIEGDGGPSTFAVAAAADSTYRQQNQGRGKSNSVWARAAHAAK